MSLHTLNDPGQLSGRRQDDTAAPSPEEDWRTSVETVDVLIIGAGVSGIGAAYYLQTRCKGKSFAILEARDAIGGTWDLFRYPGIRSDSDLFTFGYSFRPWRDERAIADGPAILRYVEETAAASGIDRHIRFGHRAVKANWDGQTARWQVEVEVGEARRPIRFDCSFLYLCAGYYDYADGFLPDWAGADRFGGPIIHPQAWPDGLDYEGKQVLVIGSGATAVTLVPELAKAAAHVTMLQRSPTYIVSLPARDRIAGVLQRFLPARLAHGLARWKNILIALGFYKLSRSRPDYVKRKIIEAAQKQVGPGVEAGRHFAPRYNPWDQRLCLVPDGDLFKAIRAGHASIVTDTIENFTEKGVRLASGKEIEADLIVAATGLKMKLMGGMAISVDGELVDPASTFLYKGMMLSGVPNLAYSIGYTNASWTLKCELIARYVCRLLNRMEARGETVVTPRAPAGLAGEPAIDLTSGYVRRAIATLPRQGPRTPWRLHQNYLIDMLALKLGRLDDDAMEFSSPAAPEGRAAGN